jgi:hypothetical protein
VTVLSLADQSEAGELASYAKRYNGGEEHVCLNILVGDTDVDVPMSPAEARRVANGLLDAAEQVDGQPS